MQLLKLGQIFKITSGGTPSRENPDFYNNGTIPWIKTGDLKQQYIGEGSEFITQLALEKSSAKVFPIGTVLIAMYGATIGATSILHINAATNQACAAFLPNDEVLPEYLYYFFKFNNEMIINLGVGGAQPNISATILKEIKFPLESLDKQILIINVLDKAQELIVKRKAQIEALDELVKSKFIEMFGDPSSNQFNWNIKNLNEISISKPEYGSGASAAEYSEDKPRYIRITDINEDGTLNEYKVSPDNLRNYEKYKLNDGDILFARTGATVGKTYIYKKSDGDCMFAGYLIRFKPDNKVINPDFLFAFTKTKFYKDWVNLKQNTVAQPNINAKQYGEELKIIVPPIELQNQFAEFINQVDKLKFSTENIYIM